MKKTTIYVFPVIAALLSGLVKAQQPADVAHESIQPVVLVSDLMRPYDDPDDHWDLATAYALAYIGAVDLKGLVVDSPENDAYVEAKNPDVAAVAMLNYITGLHVPVVTGSPYPLRNKKDKQEHASVKDMGGVNLIHDILSESKEKVKIVITGSSRDVAIAINRFPKLFEKKCSGIYLNAGLGLDDPYERARPEWNTKLDMVAYHAVFQARCPIFWIPCNVSHYVLTHGDITPLLSENMKKFFTFMYEKRDAGNWYQYLQKPLNEETLISLDEKYRSMFCTVSLLHAANPGKVADDSRGPLLPNYGWQLFIPVNIPENAKLGYIPYTPVEKSNIYLLRVDEGKLIYKKKTGNALAELLKWLP